MESQSSQFCSKFSPSWAALKKPSWKFNFLHIFDIVDLINFLLQYFRTILETKLSRKSYEIRGWRPRIFSERPVLTIFETKCFLSPRYLHSGFYIHICPPSNRIFFCPQIDFLNQQLCQILSFSNFQIRISWHWNYKFASGLNSDQKINSCISRPEF